MTTNETYTIVYFKKQYSDAKSYLSGIVNLAINPFLSYSDTLAIHFHSREEAICFINNNRFAIKKMLEVYNLNDVKFGIITYKVETKEITEEEIV